MDASIEGIYVKANFPGADTLIKLVQKQFPNITKSYIKKWYNSQLEVQLLHKRQTNKATKGHVVAFENNEMWNIDIYDLSKYHTENGNMKYIFAVIDVYSRKAYAEPMMFKDGDSCAGALQSIIMEHKVSPHVLLSDSDAAYFSKSFTEVLDKHKIILNNVIVDDHHAMGIIDNFARRITLIFEKFFIKNKNHKWVQKLQSVISTYNSTAHSSIANLTPNDAGKDEHKELIVKLNQTKHMYNKTVSDLSVGDSVRVLDTHIFKKGTEPKFSEETYKVVKVQGNAITIDQDGNEVRYKRQNLFKVPKD